MKRASYLFEKILDPNNLRIAFCKAQKGKSSKQYIQLFKENLDENLLHIRTDLLNNNYCFGDYNYFPVFDPKRRIICAAPFEDRIIHHAIMNICSIHFENHQISNSYACRKGKGTFAALEKATYFQKRYEWYLKLDVRKYFDSISHDILFEKLQRLYKDNRLLDMLYQIINSYHARDGYGIPIGNLTSQYFANHYLSFADKYVTVDLSTSAYIRYMDDIIIWGNDKSALLNTGYLLNEFIENQLDLKLKPFIFNRTSHGLPALGFIVYPNQTRLNKRSRSRYVSKFLRYTEELNNDTINEIEFSQRILSLYGFINHANSKGFAKNILQKHGHPLRAPTA